MSLASRNSPIAQFRGWHAATWGRSPASAGSLLARETESCGAVVNGAGVGGSCPYGGALASDACTFTDAMVGRKSIIFPSVLFEQTAPCSDNLNSAFKSLPQALHDAMHDQLKDIAC